MIRSVFVLGSHVQALGLARMAHDRGLEVRIFSDTAISIARYSRACGHFHMFHNEEGLLKELRSLGKNRETLLVATYDSMIDVISRNYDELSELYVLSTPNPSILKWCYNKRDTYRKAVELNIPIPDSYFPNDITELMLLSESISYPVVLKPAVMHRFHSATGKKVYLCNNKFELESYYERMTGIIPAEEVIVQEFLPGGAKALYSFGSFTAHRIVHAGFSVNRIRQNPMDFGNSTSYAISVINQPFESLAASFLSGIDFFGLSEVEFMYDERTDTYKMLEINPRAWKWHSISNRLGIDLFGMMVDDLDGKRITSITNHRAGVVWIERITDSYVAAKEILNRRLGIIEYLKSLLTNAESAVWSYRDPLPSIMYVLQLPFLFFKR